jgi:hypothetical protein
VNSIPYHPITMISSSLLQKYDKGLGYPLVKFSVVSPPSVC